MEAQRLCIGSVQAPVRAQHAAGRSGKSHGGAAPSASGLAERANSGCRPTFQSTSVKHREHAEVGSGTQMRSNCGLLDKRARKK